MERNTRQQEAVLEALRRGREALTPAEILQRARASVPTLNLSTVYRRLGALLEQEQVAIVSLPGQPARYEAACEHAHGDPAHHHHHFHCTTCDRVFALHACPGSMKKLVPNGFRVDSHDLTLHGRCPSCKSGARA
ncbi:MAG TPA: transcriptional repressor [Ramlibacter sp.]|uniref:Fur family transcriptional regulator n=1 Tax=Ramlibacter sp. TaxID=1917967 RepID=UPI002CCEB503|nr:transcriptional repressor [Ramlibacter sp.]HVZ44184.1 transcriptional repressor [Ramlibacter sp.]